MACHRKKPAIRVKKKSGWQPPYRAKRSSPRIPPQPHHQYPPPRAPLVPQRHFFGTNFMAKHAQRAKSTARKTSEQVQAYAQAAQSESTRRSYAQDLRHFIANGGTIPARPLVVAEYLATFGGRLAVATLQHRLIAIHRAHIEKGLDSPVTDRLVKRTMQGIRRTEGVAQRRVRALVKDDLLELLVTVAKQKPLKAARDKALLLIGFAGAFRRSELVTLRMDDITPHAHGIDLLIRRSKTDQEGEGRTVFIPLASAEERCPVRALQRWLELAGIVDGPLFRKVTCQDKLGRDKSLTPQSVALILKSAVTRAIGADAARNFAGHSLRCGFVTSAAMAGMHTSAIMRQSGHRSLEMVFRYIRPVQKRQIPSLL
jgi:integrase